MSNLTPEKFRRKVGISFIGHPSKTEQAHGDTVSIHSIMKRYRKTGVLDHVSKYEGTYMDMAEAPQFQEAQNIIADAKSMFETVPSHIRKDFGNDPMNFVEFMQNPDNRSEIEEYGLSSSHLPVNLDNNNQELPLPTPTPAEEEKE